MNPPNKEKIIFEYMGIRIAMFPEQKEAFDLMAGDDKFAYIQMIQEKAKQRAMTPEEIKQLNTEKPLFKIIHGQA